MRITIAIVLALAALASPVLAQTGGGAAIPVADVFEQVCIQNDDANSATAKARALGFSYPPAALMSSMLQPFGPDAKAVWKVSDSQIVLVLIGVAPFSDPGLAADTCAIGATPPDATTITKLGDLLGVGAPVKQDTGAVFLFRKTDGKRTQLDLSAVNPEAIRKGLRPTMVAVSEQSNELGPMTMLARMIIRPK
jgi:hypothetical protein